MNKEEKIVSIDMGTTKIKVVKHKHGDFYYEEYYRHEIDDIIDRAVEKEYTAILLTGSGASSISQEEVEIDQVPIPIYRYNELECVANIVKEVGKETGLVVNMGTGTSILYYDKGVFTHVTGTGLGGGTFEGLSQRLLGLTDYESIEKLAGLGNVEAVNLVINDIYEERLGWLQGDITVSNFAKQGLEKEDVALGIHSLVIEPIISMVKGILQFKKETYVYFAGGVLNNQVICRLIDKYAKFFGFEYEVIINPSFGTAKGAIEVFRRSVQ